MDICSVSLYIKVVYTGFLANNNNMRTLSWTSNWAKACPFTFYWRAPFVLDYVLLANSLEGSLHCEDSASVSSVHGIYFFYPAALEPTQGMLGDLTLYVQPHSDHNGHWQRARWQPWNARWPPQPTDWLKIRKYMLENILTSVQNTGT